LRGDNFEKYISMVGQKALFLNFLTKPDKKGILC